MFPLFGLLAGKHDVKYIYFFFKHAGQSGIVWAHFVASEQGFCAIMYEFNATINLNYTRKLKYLINGCFIF